MPEDHNRMVVGKPSLDSPSERTQITPGAPEEKRLAAPLPNAVARAMRSAGYTVPQLTPVPSCRPLPRVIPGLNFLYEMTPSSKFGLCRARHSRYYCRSKSLADRIGRVEVKNQ